MCFWRIIENVIKYDLYVKFPRNFCTKCTNMCLIQLQKYQDVCPVFWILHHDTCRGVVDTLYIQCYWSHYEWYLVKFAQESQIVCEHIMFQRWLHSMQRQVTCFVQNVYSHTTCPGLVMTNLTYGILPNWFWLLVLPILWLVRFIQLKAQVFVTS